MNRRGFVVAIFAAPLAALGIFAGSHNTITWAEFVAFMKATKMGPYKTATISSGKHKILGCWVELKATPTQEKKIFFMDIDYGSGRLVRYQRWPGKDMPFVRMPV